MKKVKVDDQELKEWIENTEEYFTNFSQIMNNKFFANVSLQTFIDDENWVNSQDPAKVVDIPLSADFVTKIGDDKLFSVITEVMGEGMNLLDVKTQENGVLTVLEEPGVSPLYLGCLKDFGYCYDFNDKVFYVKSPRLMNKLYSMFGNKYRDSYIKFCIDIVRSEKDRIVQSLITDKRLNNQELEEFLKSIDKKLLFQLNEQVKDFDEIVKNESYLDESMIDNTLIL